MGRITIGLDFGTHQTKICVEDKSDVNNPIYSFFPFVDMNGDRSIILPSIIQVNKDNTLSYGFVEKANSKYGKKFFEGITPKYPQKVELPVPEYLPEPPKPSSLSHEDSNIRERALKSYEQQLLLWNQRNKALETRYKNQCIEMERAYQNELKEWYRWQNSAQTNHRMIYRYFKQSTFSDYKWNCALSSTFLSIWYLSFVIFQLEEKYGQDFAIQMGIPTGSDNFEVKKRKAVSVILSAYHLVEEVFQGNYERFISATIDELETLTIIVPYSETKKQEYSILVFPEAYASLKSLTYQKKIEPGMSLMVDIGGGTTDISFFTIESEKPRIYNYSSIPFGLNYIIETANSNVKDIFDIQTGLDDINESSLTDAISQYNYNLQGTCRSLVDKLERSFERTEFPIYKLREALKNRVVIYSGGGSTYSQLRVPVGSFSDINHITAKVWEGLSIDKISQYAPLCPILSTALGLSISEMDDDVKLSTTEEIFKHMEGQYVKEEKPAPRWV